MKGRGQPSRPSSATSLLEAAKELLVERSPSDIGGRDISERAGVNYALIHRHYGTKDDLLYAAYGGLADEFGELLRSSPTEPFVPITFDGHGRFWRAAAHVVIDPGSATGHFIDQSLITRVRDVLAARRPELDRDHLDCLVALNSAMQFGLPISRHTHAGVGGLDPRDRAIDAYVVARNVDVHEGTGSFADPPPAPVRLPKSPRLVDVCVLPGGPGRSKVERALIAAAAELLERYPPSKISGRDIAQAAGVNYGLIHYHFGSKDEVLQHAIDFLRVQFFTSESVDGEPPPFFAICRHPGYLLATMRMSLDGDEGSIHGPYPLFDAMLAKLDLSADLPPAVEKRVRIAIITLQLTQGTWALIGDWMSEGLGRPIVDLEPIAAGYLARMLQMAADPAVPID